ncbi:Mu transposase domain-containing protein [Geodermatophilus marinus]|uniref:Mu transposase domain-containing protein n=1 Tax=Geodermatophilus sp. LHW52908 TaxID=2303986 RepID=UPI000E3CA817|nr:DDE-type integrase/transposase/recombinase [Geodermatophilus sp. LHW52908]RFU18766.1 transposase [Geodermatophilus sp. LHW52908]
MLTREEDIDVHSLRRQGWTITAIARHLGRDRKTIRAYLNGRQAGVRAPAGPDGFGPFVDYCRARLTEDPHLWAMTLFDEVVALGYDRAYSTFTRQLRTRDLRPACEPCAPARGRPAAVIEHPPGEETQFDWVELPDPPAAWTPAGYQGKAFLLVGALAHSGRWRGVLCASMEQPALIDALHRVAAALGGLTRTWRFDRMATVCHPASGRVSASFAAVAKHYGVQVAICPPRRGNRKGVVEKANHTAAQRWWRTLADDVTPEAGQASLDAFCATRGDTRLRTLGGCRGTVSSFGADERLAPLPAPFPAVLTAERKVSAQALVAYRGNFYSVPPELAGTTVTVAHRLGADSIDIAAGSVGGRPPTVLARHRLATDGAGVMIRDSGHVVALQTAVLAAFSTAAPHRRKQRIPPGPAAQAAADALRQTTTPTGTTDRGADVVIDLAAYDRAARGRNTLR